MPLSTETLANIRAFHEEISSPHGDGSTSCAPLLLAIHATSRCNFKCVHCSRELAGEVPGEMTSELFTAIAPILRTAVDVYLFGDGEVLLNIPRHLAMVARVYQEGPGCTLGFSTNGKLLTPEVYELYATAGIQYIQLSVDAASRDLYEAMRRGGHFDELLHNLEGIAALRDRSKTRQPALRLATVISKQNFRELPRLAEFAARYGFSDWYINAESPQNPGRDLLQLDSEDLAELELIRAEIARVRGLSFSMRFDPCLELSRRIDNTKPESKSPVYCTVPWQRFELTPHGDVKICPYYHEPVCSMRGRSFSDIWNGEEFRRIRRAFASGTDIPSYCVGCRLGLRKQYLPGYPGIPPAKRLGVVDRMLERFRANGKSASK